ncbi:MAG: SDR family oxidoreductase [Gemmatimonadota bacterium]|nr:SDR family oxidoreductase [Gemmatimonadota bacterium]
MRVLVTGATGLVGHAVLSRAIQDNSFSLRGSVRRLPALLPGNAEAVLVGDLTHDTDWFAALRDVNVVVHTAARVHVMRESAVDSLAEFRRVNVDGTLNLARQAVASGVRRFVFLSSIKVNGESTLLNRPFTPDDPPNPTYPYAVSKYEAEEGLRQLGKDTGLEVVIVRPVLVYGPGVKANFLSMMLWIHTGFPLPFGAIHNSRSLVAVDNLVDLLATCLKHPAASNQTFLVSDGEDLSTPELLRRTATAMHRPARLMRVPESILRSAAIIAGKRDAAERLCGSLRVDIKKTQRLLGWNPPVSVDQALSQTARYFFDGK